MTGERDLLAISEGLMSGELDVAEQHPLMMARDSTLVEISDGLAFVESFANVTALVSDDRLVLIDAGGVLHAQQVHTAMRSLDRRAARHRRVHPRPRRPRVRRSLLRGRGRRAPTRRSSPTSRWSTASTGTT